MYRQTYGSLALEHWVAEDILTWQEVADERARMRAEHRSFLDNFKLAVAQEVDRRTKEAQSQTILFQDSALSQLVAAQAARDDAEREHFEEVRKLRKERELLRAKDKHLLRSLPDEWREKILDEAVRLGVLETWDNHILANIQLFVEDLRPALEKLRKELPE